MDFFHFYKIRERVRWQSPRPWQLQATRNIWPHISLRPTIPKQHNSLPIYYIWLVSGIVRNEGKSIAIYRPNIPVREWGRWKQMFNKIIIGAPIKFFMSCTLNSLIMVYTGSTGCARAWAWCKPSINSPFALKYHEVVLTRVSSRASLSKLGLSGTSFLFLCAVSDHFPKVLVLGHSFVKRHIEAGSDVRTRDHFDLANSARVFLLSCPANWAQHWQRVLPASQLSKGHKCIQ